MTSLDVLASAAVTYLVRRSSRINRTTDAAVDAALDAGMERLHEVISRALADDQPLQQLEEEAGQGAETPAAIENVKQAIEDASENDVDVQEKLEEIIARLERLEVERNHRPITYNIRSQNAVFPANTPEGLEIGMYGDRFENIGAGATVINRSILSNSLNRVASENGDEAAVALSRIAEIIAQSDNTDAAETFNAMAEEISSPNRRKPVVKSLWNGIVEALPTITELATLGTKLSSVF